MWCIIAQYNISLCDGHWSLEYWPIVVKLYLREQEEDRERREVQIAYIFLPGHAAF